MTVRTSEISSFESSLPDGPGARVRAAIDALRGGRMVVLVGSDGGAEQGTVVVAAEHATAEVVNFLATHARGLISVPLPAAQIDRLALPLLGGRGSGHRRAAYTVSIEARAGVTTGISAADRARTIAAATAEDASPYDIVSPGHVFPIRVAEGGVVEREAHAEGAVDLVRSAGLLPAAVSCEILSDDGSVAARGDLQRFAVLHALPLVSIADVVRHRVLAEIPATPVGDLPFALPGLRGAWRARSYEAGQSGQLLLLTLGEPPRDRAAPVYAHEARLASDLVGDADLLRALLDIESAGGGVVVYLPAASGDHERIATQTRLRITVAVRELAGLGYRRLRLRPTGAPWPEALEELGLQVIEADSEQGIKNVTRPHGAKERIERHGQQNSQR